MSDLTQLSDTDESVAVYLTGLLLCRSPEVQDRISELLLESGKPWGTRNLPGKRAADLEAEWQKRDPLRRLLETGSATLVLIRKPDNILLYKYPSGLCAVRRMPGEWITDIVDLDAAIAAALKEVDR